MASRELLVLIIRDGGLRSTLIARLSLQGECLVTFNGDVTDPVLEHIGRPPAMLITDADIEAYLGQLRQRYRWDGIILITNSVIKGAPEERIVTIDRGCAAAQIQETLARWRS